MITFATRDTALTTNEVAAAQPARVRGVFGRKSSGKGGGSGSSSDANTMRSAAHFKLVEAISEGQIWGLVDGEKSIYFDQTPLMNADGSYNFKNVATTFHTGTQDEGYFNGHDAVETPVNVEVQVKKTLGQTVRTIVDENADAVRVIMRIPSLVKQDKDGGLKKTSVSYTILVRAYNGTWQEAVTNNINNQKALSPFEVSHRVELPLGGSPWDIAVRRNTDDSDDDKLQNDTYWEGYVELVEGKFMYPHTAAIAMSGNAEEMGTSIPPRSYHVKGLLVNVPSNYNPETRVYTGIWDGTFKIAWTNNPAWIFYDLIINDRYGLGEFIKPEIVDKWSLYTIAQYCDVSIKSGFKNGDTGADLYEPRYTYNGVINTKDEAYFVLQGITQAWRGMAYWATGQVFATADMPQDPVRLVSPANVIGGDFERAGTALKARHSVVIVKWNNPDDFYRPDTEVVIDSELLQKYGWREKTVQLTGCTSRGLAHRYGRWVIDTEQHETDTLTYSASWDHAEVRPGEIIAVSDPRKAQIRASGRVANHSGLVITLDDDFEWNTGETYSLMLTMPSGQIETRAILAFLDDHTVRVASAYPSEALPDAMWTITGSDIAPMLHRVLTIEEAEGNTFKLTSLFHDPTKFARVEEGIYFEPIPYERPVKGSVPPTNLLVTENGYISNGTQYLSLSLSWVPPVNFLTRGFLVSVDTPDDGHLVLGTVQTGYIDYENVVPGDYTFYVQSISYTGITSDPATITYTALGSSGFAMPTITDLRLVESATSLNFTGSDLKIQWANNFALIAGDPVQNVASPQYAFNTVKIYNATTGQLLRTAQTNAPAYVYDYLSNKADNVAVGNAGACRSIRTEVTVNDVFGRTSAVVSKVFSNPVIPLMSIRTAVNGSTVYISWDNPTDLDFAGVDVWIEKNNTFNPLATAVFYEGTNNQIVFNGLEATDYYIRIAGFDSFGKDGMLIAPAVLVHTLRLLDIVPPAVPTGLTLTTASDIAPDGTARATVTAKVNANSESDFARYEFQIKEGTGDYVSYQTGSPNFTWTVTPGRTYTVHVRAMDALSNASLYNAEASIVAAKDTVAPPVPAGLVASGTFNGVWLTWTPVVATDLDYYEVKEVVGSTTTTFQVAAPTLWRGNMASLTAATYSVRAVDTSGNASAFSTTATATTLNVDTTITTAKLSGLIDATSFATSIATPGIGATLPVAPFNAATPKTFYLTTDNQVYRQNVAKNGWTVDVNASNVVGQLVAGQIAAGAIGTTQLAAKAAQIGNLAVGDYTNLADLGWSDGVRSAWSMDGYQNFYAENGSYTYQSNGRDQAGTPFFPVVSLDSHYFDVQVYNTDATRANVYLHTQDAAGNNVFTLAGFTDVKNTWFRITGQAKVPNGHVKGRMLLQTERTSGQGSSTYWTKPIWRKATGTVMIENGAVTADKVTSGQLITLAAQIGSALINDAHIVNVNAGKLIAGSTITGSLLVDGNQSIASVQGNANTGAQDPAGRINGGSTTILPGKILISGGTTLQSWLYGNGAYLGTGTVAANVLQIGQRGVSAEGLKFDFNNPAVNYVAWTAGTIRYVGDDNNVQSRNFGSGYAQWTGGVLYIGWTKDAGGLFATTDPVAAFSASNVVLAAYRGSNDLNTNYGQTIIDGPNIKTGSIKTDQLAANIIGTNQLQANAVATVHLQSQSITADKIAVNSLDATVIKTHSISTDLLTIGGVTTDTLAFGAVSAGGGAATIAEIDCPSNVMTTVQTYSINASASGIVQINAYCTVSKLAFADTAGLFYQVWIYRNGNELPGFGAFVPTVGTNFVGGLISFVYIDPSPAEGTNTYTLRVKPQNYAFKAANRNIFATAFKR